MLFVVSMPKPASLLCDLVFALVQSVPFASRRPMFNGIAATCTVRMYSSNVVYSSLRKYLCGRKSQASITMICVV